VARWRRLEPTPPSVNHGAQPIAKGNQIGDVLLELAQSYGGDLEDFAAGRAAGIALLQDAGEVVDRESGIERALDQPHARDRGGRVAAISARFAWRLRQQPAALIESQRVGADAGEARQRSRAQRGRFARHLASIGSPVLCSRI
jgi:hypothetical protein